MSKPVSRVSSICVFLTSLSLLAVGSPVLGEGKPVPAKKAPVQRLNVYFPSDFSDQAYQKDAFGRVLSSWKPKGPAPAAGKKTVVIALIGRDGKLLGLAVHLESGQPAFDASAVDAVKNAAPFKPIPRTYPQPSIEVHWHFEVGG